MMENRFYYCPDQGRYVIWASDGGFYSVRPDGTLKFDRYFDKILIGKIFTIDITKEEFCAQLSESLAVSLASAQESIWQGR